MADTQFIIEPGRQDIVITHVFDAPRDAVFKAMTDPDLIPKWWGPSEVATVVDRMEVRPGGQWRFLHRDSEGNEFGFHGVIHDVVPGERVVQTFEFEGVPGEVALETMTLEDIDGATKVTAQSIYQSVQSRDAVVQSGMEGGARETYARLEGVLKSL
jgi:uncharacterized protein YndB with AHSA1/START domain